MPVSGLSARAMLIVLSAVVVTCAAVQPGAARKPKQSVLTQQIYRQRCLLCHKVPPYGIAPEITAGLVVKNGPTAAELMPNTTCWRRCEKCWQPAAARR